MEAIGISNGTVAEILNDLLDKKVIRRMSIAFSHNRLQMQYCVSLVEVFAIVQPQSHPFPLSLCEIGVKT